MKHLPLLIAAFMLFAFLAAGTSDYEDKVSEYERYLSDVCGGYINDYKNTGVACDE